MNNFSYHNPTRILFGDGQIAAIAAEIPELARIMLVYGGGSIKRNHVYEQIQETLGERIVSEFSGIEANPEYSTLCKAVTQVKADKIDFLLAAGGGSVIDGTKFIAAAAQFNGEPWDILLQGGRNVTSALPFGCILTLPATGSEMNAGSVVNRSEMKAKMSFGSEHCFPQFSVLDPTTTLTLPERQLTNGIVDPFVHVIEQYLTYPVGADLQDRLAEAVLQSIVETGPKALADPQNYELRANLMWCATMALNGLLRNGVPQDWSTHMIGHELTALYGLDHAQTLAVVLPANLRVRKDAKREKLLQFGERLWGVTETSHPGSADERIEAIIVKTEEFFIAMGAPTRLADYGLDESAVDAVIKQLEQHNMVALGEKKDVTLDVSRQILMAAL
ncbi:NADH-dependent alcohol dehydrogenase [Aliidiomarina taiwanensis]|uniref:NADH-dependent alcohol dehydrogenase n=1 Tax=Aliidiomarina taiwanensis TaxID=946228 RepID=A0A432X1G0_9GAMM|nr:iron-containing alcohol dehydrogenase [Aliidiomarina taiwanensis]RUO40098.1 NADH-dependent alcohol dehydrogenase [Aliidiomarina taiwanensis]